MKGTFDTERGTVYIDTDSTLHFRNTSFDFCTFIVREPPPPPKTMADVSWWIAHQWWFWGLVLLVILMGSHRTKNVRTNNRK